MTTETLISPPRQPRWWLSDITLLTADKAAGPLVHLPDAATSLVLRTASATRETELLVVGPRTRAAYHTGKDFPPCLRIRLRPGAARLLLGVSMRELVDRVIPLGELMGGTAGLAERTSGEPEIVLKRIEAALLDGRSGADLARSRLVGTAAEVLTARCDGRREQLPALARRLAVSERHLRDLFTDHVGIAPKRFERIARVRQVLTHGRTGTPRWAQLATTTGYYDQSHLTADFRALIDVPPAAFFAGRLPALHPCQAMADHEVIGSSHDGTSHPPGLLRSWRHRRQRVGRRP
ncbi:helix-turn-helix domain-containing protein [Kitasatospora kifunensis]|uniref:AraC-like DNA-binding protein n=1 Tax=Kitasatospora kifunensis TaxID=58351 RepID=A0A7W7QZJ1_KITKI|nr:helix-turn-helix domain-containing protein [Kitasatospora kifunensis]MBB4922728.1 AraC-like DNA-binding protein [Kitasatospora kifunensis]